MLLVKFSVCCFLLGRFFLFGKLQKGNLPIFCEQKLEVSNKMNKFFFNGENDKFLLTN